MRVALIMVLLSGLHGCAVPAIAVRSAALSYDDTIEDTTNKLLVLNILRAKDKAPMHFVEIPRISETIQATASVSANYPFGPLNKSLQRNTVTPGLSVQMSPNFEVDHVDTKDFVTGLASPIDPKFVKYWLDRGLDRRIVLLLFFSAADVIETANDTANHPIRHVIRIRNSPRDAIADIRGGAATQSGDCDSRSDFQHYLLFINSLKTFSARSTTERRLLADKVSMSALKDLNSIASLDPSKYQWTRDKDSNTYSIYSISAAPQTTLCYSNSPVNSTNGLPTPENACAYSVVDVPLDESSAAPVAELPALLWPPDSQAAARPSAFCAQFNRFIANQQASGTGTANQSSTSNPKMELRLETRSVGEIIQFLGDLLEYQEALDRFSQTNPGTSLTLNHPVTFGYCTQGHTSGADNSPDCSDIFFHLQRTSCNSRFTLTYRGTKYSVPNYNPLDEAGGSSCANDTLPSVIDPNAKNHTLEVLAVLNQLIDLQKSAQDIRATPYVQVVP